MHQEQLHWHTIRGNKGKQDLPPKERVMKHLLPCATDLQKGKRPQPHGVTNGRADRGLDRRVSRKLSRHGQHSPRRRQKLQEAISKAGGSTLTSQRGTERDQRAGERQTQHQLVLRKEHPPLVWGQSITQPNATARTLSKSGTLGTWRLM